MEKLIITAAICGAEVTKASNPAVPYTVEEMVREAKSAYEAGAAILHIHVRNDDGTPTQDRERFRVVMDAIRKELPDVIMIPSTGGATGMSPEERLQPTELFPEMATLDCGTCNFGDEIFDNTMPRTRLFPIPSRRWSARLSPPTRPVRRSCTSTSVRTTVLPPRAASVSRSSWTPSARSCLTSS